jgi:hypothetical protein
VVLVVEVEFGIQGFWMRAKAVLAPPGSRIAE